MKLAKDDRYLLVHNDGLALLTYLGEETKGHKFKVTRSDGIIRIMYLSEQKWQELAPFCHKQDKVDIAEAASSIGAAREFMEKLKEKLNE